jgi:serine/threonine protein kinase
MFERNHPLADCTVERVLGKGAHAWVQLVKHVPTGSLRAVKTFPFRSLLREFRKREQNRMDVLGNEVRTLSHLENNPYILGYFGAWCTPEAVHVFVEYCPGGDFFQRSSVLSKGRRMDFGVARGYVIELVAGIRSLHVAGIMHGDLKTENIMVDNRGHLKIADFGCSFDFPNFVSEDGRAGSATTTVRRGTAEYQSPEQVQGQPFGMPADMWSVGCIIYELLCGYHPFARRETAGNTNMFDRISRTNYPPPPNFVPRSAVDLIRSLLQCTPELRPTADELRHNSAFFSGVDWGVVDRCEQPAPESTCVRILDEEWCNLPTRPLISTGTVDQCWDYAAFLHRNEYRDFSLERYSQSQK